MRRALRWVVFGLAFVLLAWVTRLTLLDREAERHLGTSTAPWPPLLAPADQHPTPAWVPPGEDGACPATHPVKAKLRSGIYHLEGMAAYTRTAADRCYPSPETAEADGFRRARH